MVLVLTSSLTFIDFLSETLLLCCSPLTTFYFLLAQDWVWDQTLLSLVELSQELNNKEQMPLSKKGRRRRGRRKKWSSLENKKQFKCDCEWGKLPLRSSIKTGSTDRHGKSGGPEKMVNLYRPKKLSKFSTLFLFNSGPTGFFVL